MKKLLLTAVALVVSVASLMAENSKPRIFVEYFKVSSDVSNADASKIRLAVIDALTKTKRFEIATEDSQGSINEESERRSSTAAMHDQKARTEVITAAAHDYILKGEVHNCSYSTTVLEDGSKSYSCLIQFTLSATEVATSTTIATQQFDSKTGLISGAMYSSSTEEGALTNALTQIDEKIAKFVIEYFPNQGTIIPSDFGFKKDKVVSCYIDLGSDNGVKEGDTFVILAPKVVMGKLTYNEIGKLKISEIVSGEFSNCKVTKGHKELYQALISLGKLDEKQQKEQPIKVKSVAKFGLGDITDII